MFAEFSNFKIPSYFNVEYSWGRRTIELIDRNLTISRFELGSTQVFRLNKSMLGKAIINLHQIIYFEQNKLLKVKMDGLSPSENLSLPIKR